MPLKTKRWNDPIEPDDGFRLLVCRLRPRGVAKSKERWDAWWPDLGPSRQLLDDFHGKGERHAAPLSWQEYEPRYLEEMASPGALWRIRDLARQLREGASLTLLCSAACHDPARCHRTILARLVSAGASTTSAAR